MVAAGLSSAVMAPLEFSLFKDITKDLVGFGYLGFAAPSLRTSDSGGSCIRNAFRHSGYSRQSSSGNQVVLGGSLSHLMDSNFPNMPSYALSFKRTVG